MAQLFHLPKQLSFSNSGTLRASERLYFYLTGTTTSTPVYQDSALATPHTQPISADANGKWPVIWLDSTITYKCSRYDYSTGSEVLVDTIDPVNPYLLTQAELGGILYPRTAAEIAAGVTPTNYAYKPGVFERYGGSQSATAANNATYLTNALATGHKVTFDKEAGYYPLTGRIVAPANSWIHLDGCELRWAATAATGTNFLGNATRPGIEATGNYFQLTGRGKLSGPSTASYVLNEAAIYMTGTSSASRARGFTIRGAIEITNWGAYGLLTQFVDDISVCDPELHIHDVGYCGAAFSSSNHGRVSKINVGSITPGTSGNAYGITLSADSTGYNLDANAGTKSATNTYCWDWDVEGCTIYDIPIWTGLDAHGAYETHFRHNNIYNCGLAILLSANSGDAANYAGWSNSVIGNVCDARRRDGSATQTTTTRGGIVVNGGSTVRHQRVTVAHNKVYGYGLTSNAWHSIAAVYVQDAVISGNQIDSWAGYGIYTYGGTGVVTGNTFGALSSATSSACVLVDATSTGRLTISNNRHSPFSGTAAAAGLTVNTTTVKHAIENNDFDAATVPYSGIIQSLSGSGAVDLVNRTTLITTTGSAAALTLADGVVGDEKYLVMATDGGGDATLTPTNLGNGTTITFNDVGDCAFLKFMLPGEWYMLGGTATLA